jgi:hypothetical protein
LVTLAFCTLCAYALSLCVPCGTLATPLERETAPVAPYRLAIIAIVARARSPLVLIDPP